MHEKVNSLAVQGRTSVNSDCIQSPFIKDGHIINTKHKERRPEEDVPDLWELVNMPVYNSCFHDATMGLQSADHTGGEVLTVSGRLTAQLSSERHVVIN